MKRRGVFVIGDALAFGGTVRALLEHGSAPWRPLRYTTFNDCGSVLAPRVLRETALFVIELWRTYPTGLRAEGIAVAEQLLRVGAPALVVSPLSLSAEFATPSYWDLTSIDALSMRCEDWLTGKIQLGADHSDGFAQLKQWFAPYLVPAAEHG